MNPIWLLFAPSDLVTATSSLGPISALPSLRSSGSFDIAPTVTETTAPAGTSSKSHSTFAGARIGAAIGGTLGGATLLIALGVFFILRYRRKRLQQESKVKLEAIPNPPELHNESRLPGTELLGSQIYQLPTTFPELQNSESHQLPKPLPELQGSELYQLSADPRKLE